jgi:hypothetical protein
VEGTGGGEEKTDDTSITAQRVEGTGGGEEKTRESFDEENTEEGSGSEEKTEESFVKKLSTTEESFDDEERCGSKLWCDESCGAKPDEARLLQPREKAVQIEMDLDEKTATVFILEALKGFAQTHGKFFVGEEGLLWREFFEEDCSESDLMAAKREGKRVYSQRLAAIERARWATVAQVGQQEGAV